MKASAALLLAAVSGFALIGGSPAQSAPQAQATDVPAYHAAPPKGMQGPTLPPSEFSDPRIANAYAMAAKVKAVLYQEPCYCHCDKEVGHHSLYDCFAGDHASICQTCMQEGVFTYNETKAGKSAAQIRAEIISGQWKNINLDDYAKPKIY